MRCAAVILLSAASTAGAQVVKEVLPGVPILDSWELVNRFRGSRPRFVQRGRVIGVLWK
jgi:hypothetical protein